MSCIYIIKNDVNNKVYIGQTTMNINTRMRAHLSSAKYRNSKLYVAMRQIGISHFWIEKIQECSFGELNELEKKYVQEYDSYKNGYNSTVGGSNKTDNIDEEFGDLIVDMYNDGMSSLDISYIIGCSDITILNILNTHGIERRQVKKPVILIEKNIIFESIVSVARYLIDNNIVNCKDIWSLCNRIRLNSIKGTDINGFHIAIYDDFINGRYQPKDKVIKDKNNDLHICKICGCFITNQSKTGMCNSCANVVAKGKIPKPSKEELKSLLDKGLQKKQIADMYGRSDSTVHHWINSYNLRI